MIWRVLRDLFNVVLHPQSTLMDSTDAEFLKLGKSKSLEVQALIKAAVDKRGVRVNNIIAFGHKYDSAFWIAVSTDSQRNELQADDGLIQSINAIFRDSGYLSFIEDIWETEIDDPALEYLKQPGVVFESQETVNRDYDGSWWYRIK